MIARLYLWQGIDTSGTIHRGISMTKADLPNCITVQSLQCLWIRSKQQGIAFSWLKHCLELLKKHSLLDTCHLLKTLSHPLTQALTHHLQHALEQGFSISEALSQLPKLFPKSIRDWITIAEQCNQLNELGLKAIKKYRQHSSLKQQTRQKLMYPLSLITACLALFILLIEYLIPSMNTLYADMNQTPPAFIHTLLSIANHLGFISLSLFTLIITAIRYGKRHCSRWLNRVRAYQHYVLSLWMECLAHLLCASVPLELSLTHAARTLPAAWLNANQSLQSALQSGHSFSQAIDFLPGMTNTLKESIALGEMNHELASTLLSLSEQLQKTLLEEINLLIKSIQPICMLIISIMIGGLFYLMYAPILHLNP